MDQILAIDFNEFFAIFEKIVAVISELLKKFEKHFTFEEYEYKTEAEEESTTL